MIADITTIIIIVIIKLHVLSFLDDWAMLAAER
jgi:hypothetical protein